MKKSSLALSLFCALTLSAQANLQTLKTPDGKVVTTDEAPRLLAVEDKAAGQGHVMFMFYRTSLKNNTKKNKEHIVYQYAQVLDENSPLVWSKPHIIDRDEFRSRQGVVAATVDGRIYLFGKRDGIRYTAATLEDAMNNKWQPFAYLKSGKDKIESAGQIDVTSYVMPSGDDAIAVTARYERNDFGHNEVVTLHTCQANGPSLHCGARSKVSGLDLSKQFFAKAPPAVTYAPDLSQSDQRSLYVIWPSSERWQDSGSYEDFLYFRRSHGQESPQYYGDFRSDGVTRPRRFVNKSNQHLGDWHQVTALEHNGALEVLIRNDYTGKTVSRFRYEDASNSERIQLTRMPMTDITTKSTLSAISLNNKLYVAYQNIDNSLNYLVIE